MALESSACNSVAMFGSIENQQILSRQAGFRGQNRMAGSHPRGRSIEEQCVSDRCSRPPRWPPAPAQPELRHLCEGPSSFAATISRTTPAQADHDLVANARMTAVTSTLARLRRPRTSTPSTSSSTDGTGPRALPAWNALLPPPAWKPPRRPKRTPAFQPRVCHAPVDAR